LRNHTQSSNKLLALDAMGVIFSEADDGPNLLYPFIVEKGGCSEIGQIVHLWSAASLGKISSAEFWKSAGVDPALEDEYLQKYRLSEGLIEFLAEMDSRGTELWCLSNNISEWSRKLCEKFRLDRYFHGFVVSGDTGTCKPDPAIYLCLLEKAGYQPSSTVFVDDRVRNLVAADMLGITPILFNQSPQELQGHRYKTVRSFAELRMIL
jgi:putative hydrolase of the HAD superfamily